MSVNHLVEMKHTLLKQIFKVSGKVKQDSGPICLLHNLNVANPLTLLSDRQRVLQE